MHSQLVHIGTFSRHKYSIYSYLKLSRSTQTLDEVLALERGSRGSHLVEVDANVDLRVSEKDESERIRFEPEVRVPNASSTVEAPLPQTPVEDDSRVTHVGFHRRFRRQNKGSSRRRFFLFVFGRGGERTSDDARWAESVQNRRIESPR